MIHIREKNSGTGESDSYTVIVTSNWVGPIEDHPSLIEIPDKVELVDAEIPSRAQYAYYPTVNDSCLGV